MGLDLTCPKCSEQMKFDFKSTRISCGFCGYGRGTGLDEKIAEIQAKKPRQHVVLENPDRINARAVSLFYSAHDYLYQEDEAQALYCLKSAVDIQADFLDAHLWLAKLTDDEKLKRDHLSTVLAYNPGHLEATRMMLVLNGRLTPEQAERTINTDGPILQHTDGPVTTRTTTPRCPNCEGDLTTIDGTRRIECRFCGYSGEQSQQRAADGDLLVAALLERKAQAVRWVIGERLLHCNHCGAERTLAADQLSMRCPFCNSNHVIEQDALGSFEQPTGLIPFRISREQAGQLVKARLKSFTERVIGWFDDNKVSRATLNGYYLPFWVFDAITEITRTRVDNSPSPDRKRFAGAVYQQSTLNDAIYDVEVCAVKSPPDTLTMQLGDYEMRDLVAYEPKLLAKYPAQLYTVDFDAAALRARQSISNVMRARHMKRGLSDDKDVTINVYSNIQSMSFQLVLMPVWIATLVERDGDTRMALVNGQTGKASLSKSEKRKRP